MQMGQGETAREVGICEEGEIIVILLYVCVREREEGGDGRRREELCIEYSGVLFHYPTNVTMNTYIHPSLSDTTQVTRSLYSRKLTWFILLGRERLPVASLLD